MAGVCIDALDSQCMKALAEPAWLVILKLLVRHRRLDVGALAHECPQDRRVVLRHLHILALMMRDVHHPGPHSACCAFSSR
jgi:hypothetical protein